jgi:hypothetical protein
MSDELITVWRGPSAEQAQTVKRMLDDRGVEVFVAACETAMGEWTVLAPPDKASRVRRFIEQAEEPDQEYDDDDLLDDRVWRQWPRCGECNAHRITRCRYCGSTGSDFPVADGAPIEEAEAAILLCCAICDEPFEPEFYRRCAECGEDFGRGIDVPLEGDPDLANPRVHFMLAALVGGSVIAMLYYLFALR